MLRKIVLFFTVFLAVAFIVEQADANGILQLRARGPGNSNNVNIIPGQEILLTISLESLSPLVTFSGGDFMLHSGSDATFQQANYDLDGPGGWTSFPSPGGTRRFLTGGPDSPHVFINSGDTLQVGRIALRGGSVGSYSTSFSQVLQLNGSYQPITTQVSNFTYNVVPEPSSAMLVGLCAIGFALPRRRI